MKNSVISKSLLEVKNMSVGYLPAKYIDEHFKAQNIDLENASVEYLVIRRAKSSTPIEDNKENVFAGYSSFPGGVGVYGETSMDSVVRNTYEQTGIDLTDHENYWLVSQYSDVFKMRYLPNMRVIVAKPFIFLQLVPEVIPLPKPDPKFVSMYIWSHVDFLYEWNLAKHLEYRDVTTEIIKRDFKHVKLAHLKIPNSEKYKLKDVLNDSKKWDPMFSLCGVTLGMAITLLESWPKVYDANKYSALSRKQFSIQLKRFNPEYFGFLGDHISKHTIYRYMMNADKKWKAIINDSQEEVLLTVVAPSLIVASSLAYFLSRRRKTSDKKPPSLAKI